MKRAAPDAGVVGLVWTTVRAHVVAAVLVVVAAGAALLGTAWPDDAQVAMRVYAGETPADDVDARLVSALLERRDGAWTVREGDLFVADTMGRRQIDVSHESPGGHLFPWAWQMPLWAPGGPMLRRRVPDWSVVSDYRILRRGEPEGRPGFGVDDSEVRIGGWRGPSSYGRADLGEPMIASGFNPFGRSIGYAIADGELLHLAALLPHDAGDPADVAAWRGLVAEQVERLAGDVPSARTAELRVSWWRSHQIHVVTQAALAAVLRVPETRDGLATLEDDLYRDLTSGTPGAAFSPGNARDALRCAIFLLGDTDAEAAGADIGSLSQHFTGKTHARRWLRGETPPAEDDDAWTWHAPRGPDPIAFYVPAALLALVAWTAWGGGTSLRRRDVVALAIALVTASVFRSVVPPHVTAQSPGLMAAAVVLAHLRRRGALTVPRGVVHGLATAALLLPVASVTRLPVLDALGRAAAFVAVATLALGALDPHARTTDAPRRVARKRDVAWPAMQILAVTGCVLALLLAMLDPTSWATRAPRPRWILVGVGLVLALAAGTVAFLRSPSPRPQPAAVCALTLAALGHVAFLAASPFPRDRLSGSAEVGRVGMLAAATLVVFAIGRLVLVARAHRELRPAAATPDHRPR